MRRQRRNPAQATGPNPLLYHLGLIKPFPIVGARAINRGDPPPDQKKALPIDVTPEMHALRGITVDQNTYIVRTVHKGKQYRAGRFKDVELAKVARDNLEKDLGKTITVQARANRAR